MTDIDSLLRLDEIAEKYFSLTPRTARRKAALGCLPVPAFRLSGGRKGPFFVRQEDLGTFIQRSIQTAEKLNHKMRLAGATA